MSLRYPAHKFEGGLKLSSPGGFFFLFFFINQTHLQSEPQKVEQHHGWGVITFFTWLEILTGPPARQQAGRRQLKWPVNEGRDGGHGQCQPPAELKEKSLTSQGKAKRLLSWIETNPEYGVHTNDTTLECNVKAGPTAAGLYILNSESFYCEGVWRNST